MSGAAESSSSSISLILYFNQMRLFPKENITKQHYLLNKLNTTAYSVCFRSHW